MPDESVEQIEEIEAENWFPEDIDLSKDTKLIMFENEGNTFIAVNPALGPEAARDLLFGSLIELITSRLVGQLEKASMRGFVNAQGRIAKAMQAEKLRRSLEL